MKPKNVAQVGSSFACLICLVLLVYLGKPQREILECAIGAATVTFGVGVTNKCAPYVAMSDSARRWVKVMEQPFPLYVHKPRQEESFYITGNTGQKNGDTYVVLAKNHLDYSSITSETVQLVVYGGISRLHAMKYKTKLSRIRCLVMYSPSSSDLSLCVGIMPSLEVLDVHANSWPCKFDFSRFIGLKHLSISGKYRSETLGSTNLYPMRLSGLEGLDIKMVRQMKCLQKDITSFRVYINDYNEYRELISLIDCRDVVSLAVVGPFEGKWVEIAPSCKLVHYVATEQDALSKKLMEECRNMSQGARCRWLAFSSNKWAKNSEDDLSGVCINKNGCEFEFDERYKIPNLSSSQYIVAEEAEMICKSAVVAVYGAKSSLERATGSKKLTGATENVTVLIAYMCETEAVLSWLSQLSNLIQLHLYDCELAGEDISLSYPGLVVVTYSTDKYWHIGWEYIKSVSRVYVDGACVSVRAKLPDVDLDASIEYSSIMWMNVVVTGQVVHIDEMFERLKGARTVICDTTKLWDYEDIYDNSIYSDLVSAFRFCNVPHKGGLGLALGADRDTVLIVRSAASSDNIDVSAEYTPFSEVSGTYPIDAPVCNEFVDVGLARQRCHLDRQYGRMAFQHVLSNVWLSDMLFPQSVDEIIVLLYSHCEYYFGLYDETEVAQGGNIQAN